ncbi:hypothetical protein SEA_ELITE2014_123 [Mycobacterium phage Elite2014]|nr:hypothetical protein SEA_CHOSENONE_124 [Mycobacterium phage ChosenOne]QGJ95191.1 hypothetical protein SEA_ELITE2014_123 [Mycobacterium phage Elite2014]QGJ96135.1 hypothetical protein SEA_LILPICKLE_123 [Mycobacterium phage Lilpickle]
MTVDHRQAAEELVKDPGSTYREDPLAGYRMVTHALLAVVDAIEALTIVTAAATEDFEYEEQEDKTP